ncbi:hypothetical protein BDP27DRAFT_1346233 [Rhodocollybia butyracea]|uniref:LIM zinc-binding domain-containing protein n=1 Tax=Rhodocollybia butyracea TaxID=206335 RepID=A0A9P5P2M7_9AGAR|nr:hypothetical protein BDP27DRAFT_1346233 [Rhodocollybia butyracea]
MDVVGDNLARSSVPLTVSSNATGLSQIVGDDDLAAAAAVDRFTNTLGRNNGNAVLPVMSTLTGTRYGTALGGSVAPQATGSPRKWGGAPAPNVPSAIRMKAVGKTWHKGCLRCTECNTILDSTKLRDHQDIPFCSRCYNKLHGPQGNGYALLGKAGG